MSGIVGYILSVPLIILIYYSVINFIFGNTVKKIGFLGFSVEKQLKYNEKITENKKYAKKKK